MTPLAPTPFAEPYILKSLVADVVSTHATAASSETSPLVIGTSDQVDRFRIAAEFERRVARAIADEIDAIRSGFLVSGESELPAPRIPLVLTAPEKASRTAGLTKLLHEEGLYGDILQGPLTVDVLHSRALTLMNARVRNLMHLGS